MRAVGDKLRTAKRPHFDIDNQILLRNRTT